MAFPQGLLKTRKDAYVALAPLVALLLLWPVLVTGLLDRLENLTVDARFQLRARSDPAGDPRVIFVKIDEPSVTMLGQWPWSRSIHGRFCQLLADQNPCVVAFDILFTEPGEKQGDDDLGTGAAAPRAFISGAEIPKDTENRVPTTDYGKTRPLTKIEGDISKIAGGGVVDLPIPSLRGDTYFAFVDVDPSDPTFDPVRREVPMVVHVGHDVFPGLALQILCQYWGVGPDQVQVNLGRDIELPTPEGIKSIPIDASGNMLLNYRSQASYAKAV
jgi:hypothetical protein